MVQSLVQAGIQILADHWAHRQIQVEGRYHLVVELAGQRQAALQVKREVQEVVARVQNQQAQVEGHNSHWEDHNFRWEAQIQKVHWAHQARRDRLPSYPGGR